MDKEQWSRMALLSVRRNPTKRGNLLSCLREFLALTETQRHTARIIVPECVQINRGNSTRTLSGQALVTLAARLPQHGHLALYQ
ncbi:MAG: hypothetical protein EOO77_37330 [Oxalobacteraceae bacterium]|nr:MAG: hypothetical protein EOO77_37330 [Oxalobacteraceae bacterium]